MASLIKLFWSLFRRDQPHGRSSRISGSYMASRPCHPEFGIGLLAALAAPASSYLRVAMKPVTTGVFAVMTDLCCNGACSSVYCCGTLDGATTSSSSVGNSCTLCSYRLDGARAVYMYRSLPFCSRGCRFDYFMKALYDKRHRELTGTPAGNSIRSADVRAWLVSEEEEETFRKIFFCR